MRGTMMDYPLTLQQFLDRNRRLFGAKEVVTRTGSGMHRYTYAEYNSRVCKLANALRALGVQRGDRVATFAWNTYRHLEFYYAVPCLGAVLHTVNIRLSPEQTAFIINDAGSRVLAVDPELLSVLAPVWARLTTVERVLVLGESAPEGSGYLSYESLLADASADVDWPQLDENDAAGICYSSGTTGNPKGVVYSHRAIYLHTMGVTNVDSLALSESDRVMPVVPMFHANAWGLPHAAVAMGAAQVLPGVAPTPADIVRLVQSERVTLGAGVPTVWIGVLQELRKEKHDVSSLRRITCGGSAAPRSMIESLHRQAGVGVQHAWGMTETTPVASVCRLKSTMSELTDEERFDLLAKQGLPVLGIDVTIMDEEGHEQPWDGQTMGEIVVRGPWVTERYLHVDAPERITNGWFRTGDVAVIDPEGYVQIVDRTKDLVRSGGEWISSVELENAIMAHPGVLEAAVVATHHEKWGERPLALVVRRPDATVTEEEILEFIRPRVARFAVPDEVRFIDEVPKTSVGKFDKKALRQRYAATPESATSAR